MCRSVFYLKIHKTTVLPTGQEGLFDYHSPKMKMKWGGGIYFCSPKSFYSSIACFQWLVIIFQLLDWLLGLELQGPAPECCFWPGYTQISQ